jgi:hypothetical protein
MQRAACAALQNEGRTVGYFHACLGIVTRGAILSLFATVLALGCSAPRQEVQRVSLAAADTTGVITAAFESLIGRPPYNHPIAPTTTVCLQAYNTRATEFSVPQLTAEQLERLGERLRAQFGFYLASSCKIAEDARTPGGAIVDEQNQPAVHVRLDAPRFASANAAQIYLSESRGGKAGREVVCSLSKSVDGTWETTNCRTLAVSDP